MIDGSNISLEDRDNLIRTVLGEAGNQSDEGKAAVAHVIVNRLASGNHGSTPSDVVFEPKQFESWKDPDKRKKLRDIPENSGQYQRAASVVDGVLSGQIEDPTGGAVNFLNKKEQAKRVGGLPDWAKGEGQQIGDHTFFGAPQQTADSGDILDKYGVKTPERAASDAKAGPDVFDQYGVKMPEPVKATAPQPDVSIGANGRPQITVRPQSYGEGMTNQVVQGMPIVAPIMDRAVAATGAGIQPLMGKGKDKNFGERYEENLNQIRAENEKFAHDNPTSSIIANLAGGGMLLGPVMSTNAGGIALGAKGPNLASRVVQGTVGNAALGAVDTYGRGDLDKPDPNAVGQGAVISGAGGAAGPLAAQAVESGTRAVTSALRSRTGPLGDMNSNAVSKLVNAAEGETPQSMLDAGKRAGPHGFVSDYNTGLTDLAGGIADSANPQAKGVVRDAYKARADAQRDRVDKVLTDAMGPRTNIEDFKKFTTETRAAAADPLYEQWRTMPVTPTKELKALMPRLEAAGAFDNAEELAKITGKSFDKKFFTPGAQKNFPTAESWDLAKQGLDRKIDSAYSAGDKGLARALIGLKHDMISEIEKTPAGKVWNQARMEFADRSAILDQVEAGRDTFIGGRSGLSRDELAEELRTLKGPELAARIQGARNAVDQAMGETLNGDTTMRNKLLAPNNQEKLRLLLGDDKKADALIQSLKQEHYLGTQDTNVRGGTQTTPKRERLDALKAEPVEPWNWKLNEPMSYLPPKMRESMTLHHIINGWKDQNAQSTMDQLAPFLTKQGPEVVPALRAILAEGQRRAAGAAQGQRMGGALGRIITGPGATTARIQMGAH